MKIGAFAERKKIHFEDPQLELPFCTFFADRISLNEQPIESEPQSLATSPSNERLNGTKEPKEATAQKAEKNGNVTATQPEASMVSTGDDFIMVDLVIFLLADFCFLCMLMLLHN